MSIHVDITRLSKVLNDSVDYENIVFRVKAANVLDLGEADKMWTLLRTLIEGGAKYFIADMADLDFIDSSGIGVLINAAKLTRAKKGDIVMLNVSERIEQIFNPIKLQKFIKIFNAKEEATHYFQLL